MFDRCLTAPIWLFCRLCQTGRGLRWICRLICCAQHLVQSCFAGRFLVFSLSGLDLDDLPAVWHITHNALMWPPSDGGWHLKSTFPPLIRHVLSLSRSGKIHHITFPDHPPFCLLTLVRQTGRYAANTNASIDGCLCACDCDWSDIYSCPCNLHHHFLSIGFHSKSMTTSVNMPLSVSLVIYTRIILCVKHHILQVLAKRVIKGYICS